MNQALDWNQRKHEIGTAFCRQPILPPEADPQVYEGVLRSVGAVSKRDVSILISIVQDAIMMARREERPAVPLETFRDWLMKKLMD